MNLKQLNALVVMALALLKRLVLTPFLGKGQGGAWLGRLASESLAATPKDAWERLERSSRCIGCGLCGSVTASSLHETVLGIGREPADAPLVLDEAARLARLAQSIARICPARVGIEDITTLVRENAGMLDAARRS